MPGFSAGSAYVDLVPRLQKGWSGAVEKEVDGPLGRIRSKAGGIGKAIGVGLGAGVVGGGALLLKLGSDLDGALDNIQTKTGLVGKELEGVQDSFRNVAKRVPDDLGRVSDAVAMVAQKTDLTGKPLEELSTQILTLSRLTGQDLASTIEQSSRFFGDWGLSVEQQGPALDELFRLSQKTGVGVGDLQDRLVKFGGPLRQLGFGWEESAALIAKFQKEGVNTDLVMGSLRISLGKMAKAGEDPQKTLARVTDEIKNAGSAGEANALALELFGARAGPDMAAAIREGRFEVDDLVSSIKGGKGTILDSAKATDDFGEKWGALRNRITLALEPIAGKVFDLANELFDYLAPVGDWFAERLPGWIDKATTALEPWVSGVKEAVSILFRGDFTGAGPWAEDSPIVDGLFRLRDLLIDVVLPAAKRFFGWITTDGKPVLIALAAALGLIVAPFLTVGAALVYAYVRFEGFRNLVDAVLKWLVANVPPIMRVIVAGIMAAWTWLRTNVPPIVATIVAGVMAAWAWIRDNVLPIVKMIVATIVDGFAAVVAWVQENWPAISEAIGHVVAVIRGIIERAVDFVLTLWTTFGDELLNIAMVAWDFVRSTVENAINLVRSIVETVLAIINGDWSDAWDGIKGIVSAVWDSIVDLVTLGIELAKQALSAGLDALKLVWDTAWQAMKDVLGGLWDGLEDAAKAAMNAILGALEAGINSAIDLLNTALDGIDKAAGPLVNFGEIPHVDLPELRGKGGDVKAGRDYIVGELGPELLRMGASGGHVVSNRNLRELGGGTGRAGIVLEDGAVRVDARGIEEPETVGDYAARQIGWRLNLGGKR